MKRMMKNSKKSGFTLLELLVVVAILAAIAGTATVALKDTDARASAAAHVAMMDELNKGINTYRVLKKNTLPTRFDSLLAEDGTDPGCLGFAIEDEGLAIVELSDEIKTIMVDGGCDALMYIDNDFTDTASGLSVDADGVQAIVESRANAIVANNVFMSGDSGSGCGELISLTDTNATVNGLFWTGNTERLTGNPESLDYGEADAPAFLLTGIGPSSSLFDTTELGGMTTVPSYRHVAANEYGRFIAVWNVGNWVGTEASAGITPADQFDLVTIVDGALDTKEEELGEWDGTRNTI